MEDIFVPKSTPADALVGPLHTVSIVTHDAATFDRLFRDGYHLTASDWQTPAEQDWPRVNDYLGFHRDHRWRVACYTRAGVGANLQIRVFDLKASTPLVRQGYEGLYCGGATISFPVVDMPAHEKRMTALGVESTVGIRELQFKSPAGETYTSAEILYKVPENVFLLAVRRPEIFLPVGPIDPADGMGGAAYSARCVAKADAINDMLRDVLGYEIRRDMMFDIGENSAIYLPAGIRERFIQAFAPGSRTGYLILMDHGSASRPTAAPSEGPPNRGIVMWSFPTRDLAAVHARAVKSGARVKKPPGEHGSPFLGRHRSMLLEDPEGFVLEVFEAA
ncbi:MAG: hypothetical protein R3E77_00455 [Steroidobacteraceae bacterium]